MYAGLAVRSIQTALQELHEKDIVSIETQRGRPASIQYLPQLKLSRKNSKGPKQLPLSHGHETAEALYEVGNGCRSIQGKVGNGCRSSSEKILPQTPADKEPVSDGTPLALNDSPKIFKKQQQGELPWSMLPQSEKDSFLLSTQYLKDHPDLLDYADLVGHSLVKQKIGEKGSAFVVSVLKAMAGRNGSIDDPAAYFASCCSRGFVPWSRAQKAETLATDKREERLAREEADRERWEQETESVLAEQDDPEAQARIKATQAAFWEKMGDYRPPEDIAKFAEKAEANFLETIGVPERVHNPPP